MQATAETGNPEVGLLGRDQPCQDEAVNEKRKALLDIVVAGGLTHFDEPVELASGELSRDFIDAKHALARGSDLRLACEVIADIAAEAGVSFDAVGGLTLGADQFAHGVAMVTGARWFVIRKQPKGRGTDKWVEGAALGPGVRVLLVDDVITTGGSIRLACERVRAEGAEVVLATTLVDRGDIAARYFDEAGVVYRPVFTYHDLAIVPVGG